MNPPPAIPDCIHLNSFGIETGLPDVLFTRRRSHPKPNLMFVQAAALPGNRVYNVACPASRHAKHRARRIPDHGR
jgi:hypothetical protein